MSTTKGKTFEGSTGSTMLLIGTAHSADICHVTIAAGQGTLKRGTVLAVNADEKCCILGTENCTAAFILAEDADPADETDMVAPAYRSGDFNKGALLTKEGYTMTEQDIRDLRNGGIYLGNVM